MLFVNKLKYYKRLADISIYRWDMVHEEDVRWLIIGDNSEMNISHLQANKLQKCYADLLEQFEYLELPLLNKKKQIAAKVIDYILASLEGTTDIKKLENAKIIMTGLLTTSDPDISWLYHVDIAETADQRAVITELAIAIKDYNNQQKKDKDSPKMVLSEQAARMSNILGFKIDVKTTMIPEFRALQKEANDKIKWQTANR